MERDIRAVSESIDMATRNLALLREYGKEAWEHDIAHASATLDLLREELEAETRLVEQMEASRRAKISRHEKEVGILEKDFFSYLRNNERVLYQVKVLEQRAKDLVDNGHPLTPEQERVAQSLLI